MLTPSSEHAIFAFFSTNTCNKGVSRDQWIIAVFIDNLVQYLILCTYLVLCHLKLGLAFEGGNVSASLIGLTEWEWPCLEKTQRPLALQLYRAACLLAWCTRRSFYPTHTRFRCSIGSGCVYPPWHQGICTSCSRALIFGQTCNHWCNHCKDPRPLSR